MVDDRDPTTGSTPEAPAVSTHGTKGLEAYLEAEEDRYTADALKAAAVEAGWEPAVVDGILEKVRYRRATVPVRASARTVVRLLYVGGFAVLSLGMLANPAGGQIGIPVLLIALGLVYAVAAWWVRSIGVGEARSTGDLVALLSLPVILWLVITGLCVATGLPGGGRVV